MRIIDHELVLTFFLKQVEMVIERLVLEETETYSRVRKVTKNFKIVKDISINDWFVWGVTLKNIKELCAYIGVVYIRQFG